MEPNYQALYVHLFGRVEDASALLSKISPDATPDQVRAAAYRALDILSAAQRECEELYLAGAGA